MMGGSTMEGLATVGPSLPRFGTRDGGFRRLKGHWTRYGPLWRQTVLWVVGSFYPRFSVKPSARSKATCIS